MRKKAEFMKKLSKILLLSMCSLITFNLCSCTMFKKETKKTTPQNALERLINGNKRYVDGRSTHPNRSSERRKEISSKQKPFAIIVGCSDSRVAPEIIFDEGLGDLFVVRVAGNVIGPIELDSIDYSALYLNSSIIIVLGHENCGAVDATLNDNTSDIKAVATLIEPAIQKTQKSETKNPLEFAIKTNATNMKDYLEQSPNIEKLIKQKKIAVHAAYYNLKTGVVELLND